MTRKLSRATHRRVLRRGRGGGMKGTHATVRDVGERIREARPRRVPTREHDLPDGLSLEQFREFVQDVERRLREGSSVAVLGATSIAEHLVRYLQTSNTIRGIQGVFAGPGTRPDSLHGIAVKPI